MFCITDQHIKTTKYVLFSRILSYQKYHIKCFMQKSSIKKLFFYTHFPKLDIINHYLLRMRYIYLKPFLELQKIVFQ